MAQFIREQRYDPDLEDYDTYYIVKYNWGGTKYEGFDEERARKAYNIVVDDEQLRDDTNSNNSSNNDNNSNESIESDESDQSNNQNNASNLNSDESTSVSSDGGFSGSTNGKDPMGRWTEMPEHHGKEWIEGKKVSVIVATAEDNGKPKNSKFIYTNKKDGSETESSLVDHETAQQLMEEFKNDFNEQVEIEYANAEEKPKIDDFYDLRIITVDDISKPLQQNGQPAPTSDEPKKTSEELVAEATEELTADVAKEQAASLIQIQIAKATKPIKVAEYTKKSFNANKKTLEYYIKAQESQNAEEATEEDEKKVEEEAEKNTEKKANKTLGAIAKIANDCAKAVSTAMAKVGEVAEEGIDYVKKQINSIKEAIKKKQKVATQQEIQKLLEQIEEEAKAIGQSNGEKMAEQYNKLLEKQAKKIVNAKKKNVSKAQTKAEAAVQKAKLKIMAMTGISL